jgi:hypothetical protein
VRRSTKARANSKQSSPRREDYFPGRMQRSAQACANPNLSAWPPRGIKDATACFDYGLARLSSCREGRNRVSNLTITVNDKQHAVSADPDTPLLYVLCPAQRTRIDGGQIRLWTGPVRCVFGAHGHAGDQGLRNARVDRAGQIDRHAGRPAGAVVEDISVREEHATAAPSDPAGLDRPAGAALRLLPERHEAASLLHENASPTNQQIREALDGHICRCGTHMRVMAAVEKAAQEMRKDIPKDMRKEGSPWFMRGNLG